MARKDIDEKLKELKNAIASGNVLVGTASVLKSLKTGGISKVFLSSNCPDTARSDIGYYAKLSETPVLELELDTEELGVFCKKNFFVSVLALTVE